MGFLKTIKNLITYTEPSGQEPFELLEDYSEKSAPMPRGLETTSHSDSGDKEYIIGEKTQTTKKALGKKSPLTMDQWSRERKSKASPPEKAPTTMVSNIDNSLAKNRQMMEKEFNVPENQDVVIRDLKIGQNTNAFIVYIDGMADRTVINNFILRPLMVVENFKNPEDECSVDYISQNILTTGHITVTTDYNEAIGKVLEGLTALFMEGCDKCILIGSQGFDKRNVDQPVTESVISGPHEAFIEDLNTNITLVRKIIKNKNLVTEILPAGKTNNSKCGVMYIKGIANNEVIQEVKRRIESLDIDLIMGTGMLDQLIEDHPFALFPQILTTERPDRTASFLMEGKVVIICDGTPYSSVVPITFFHMLHSSEDSFLRWQFGTFLRLIRFMAFGFALFLPGFYVALTLYHDEMIPTELILAIEQSRENVPFPAIVEILLMEVSLELIREAGIRVPDVIGHTLGIIGALILGQSAVSANLVSPILVIIVAITGLGDFAIPTYHMALAVRILKFTFIFLGATMGFYGLALGLFVISGFACNMKSFGVPYFSPIAPRTKINPDVIFRQPMWKQRSRPDSSNAPDSTRTGRVVRGWANKGGKKK